MAARHGRQLPIVTVRGPPAGQSGWPRFGDVGSSLHRVTTRVATLCVVPLYATYGSNMDPGQMMERAPYSPLAGTGWLPGWRLTFGGEDLGWEGALATIVEDPDSQVFAVLYDVSPRDESRLDRWEGALGLYRKIRLRVQTLEGSVLAWLYVLDAYEGGLPSARYLGVVADAAEAAGAPADYVADLRIRPCQGIGP
jgi:AIG2 family protein